MVMDGNTYKLDDCLRSAKVGETCKPGTTVCLVTETEAITISQKRYGTGSLQGTFEVG